MPACSIAFKRTAAFAGAVLARYASIFLNLSVVLFSCLSFSSFLTFSFFISFLLFNLFHTNGKLFQYKCAVWYAINAIMGPIDNIWGVIYDDVSSDFYSVASFLPFLFSSPPFPALASRLQGDNLWCYFDLGHALCKRIHTVRWGHWKCL